MTAHRSSVSESYWIEIDEAATLLSARAEEVLSLAREGSLAARAHGAHEIYVRADDVIRLAEALPQPKSPRVAKHRGGERSTPHTKARS